MGFLDKFSKAIGSLKDQVGQSGVVDKLKAAASGSPGPSPATSSGTPPGPPVGTGPSSVAEGADLADKRWWPTASDISDLTGLAIGPPADITTPDSHGVRFSGADGRGMFTYEIHCITEESMVEAGGARAWIDRRATAHDRHHVIGGFADYAVAAADGDSHFVCYAGLADALFYVAATSPGTDEATTVERIMRKLYDWPE